MAASGNVQVDNTDIGCSDHFLVWMELGRVANSNNKTGSSDGLVGELLKYGGSGMV